MSFQIFFNQTLIFNNNILKKTSIMFVSILTLTINLMLRINICNQKIILSIPCILRSRGITLSSLHEFFLMSLRLGKSIERCLKPSQIKHSVFLPLENPLFFLENLSNIFPYF